MHAAHATVNHLYAPQRAAQLPYKQYAVTRPSRGDGATSTTPWNEAQQHGHYEKERWRVKV